MNINNKHINRNQDGFTLVELMIVTAIISILAAIAILSYQNYTTRAKVSELIISADACKTSVSEVYQSKGTLPVDLNNSDCTSNSTKYVANLEVTDGVIEVTASNILSSSFSDPLLNTYVLTPILSSSDNILSWDCTSSTIQTKYLPTSCH